MMNTEWSTTTKNIVAVGLVLFGLYILYLSRSVIALVVIAALIAFLLMPLVDFFQRRFKLPRGVAVLLTYVVGVILLLLAPLVFIPPIIDGFNFLAGIDPEVLTESTLRWAENTLLSLKNLNIPIIDPSLDPWLDRALIALRDTETGIVPTSFPSFATIFSSLRSAITVTYGLATNLAGTVFSGVVTFIVLLLSSIYISMDGPQFARYFLKITPRAYRGEVAILGMRLAHTWRAYFRGQLTLMFIIGFVTWIGNTALGLPGAFALAVIAGLMELIPNLGPFLALIPAFIVALLQGSTYLGVSNWVFALMIIGLYVLIQQFENTFVVPRVLGEAVNLHPLVVMLGVLVGASVAGILGALLAAPVIASTREIIRYLYFKILGEEPFPPGQELPVEKEPFWRKYVQAWLAPFQRKPVPPVPIPVETQTPPATLETVTPVEENKPK
jgi:predicted PurR-regulated permease PerM